MPVPDQDPQRKRFALLTQQEMDDLDRKMQRLTLWRKASGLSVVAFVRALNAHGVATSTTTYRRAETDRHRGARLLHNKPQVYYTGQKILKRRDR